MRRLTICLILAAAMSGTPAWAQPGTNPFAPKAKPPAEQTPAAETPAAPPANPFAPKAPPADGGSTNPFAPKPAAPKPAPTKPADAPVETPNAPKVPAEIIVGTGWSVRLDPSTGPLATATPSLVTAPGPAPSSDARRERSRYRIVTPDLPSPYVGLGLNERESDARDFWDLSANRKVGTIKGIALESSRLMAVSPDGALFAAKPQFDDFVIVVNVATGKTVKTIPTPGLRLELVAFSAANRLVLAENGRCVVHSLPEGRREREIQVERWNVGDGWTLSPGGQYLAVVKRESSERNLVQFLDLTTGEPAGTCRLAGEPGDALGIALSRDGRRLASVIHEGESLRVVQIELEGPKRLPDIPVSVADVFGDENYQGRPLEALPDGGHFLIAGRVIVDASRSEVARTLPPPPVSPLVSPGPGITLALNGRELSPIPLNLQIDQPPSATAPMPEPRPSVPLVGPAVVEGDRSSAARKSFPVAGRWDVRLASPPAVPEKLDTDGFKIPGGFVHQVVLAAGTPPIAAVSYAAAPLGVGASTETAAWVETFDLVNGIPKNRVDFPFPTVAVSVNAGATTVATLAQDGSGRVDLWSLSDGVHLGGCQPAGPRADGEVPWFVEFVDAQHLLIAVADELAVWEVPGWKQVYSLSIGSIRPALSPARDHVLVSVPNESRIAVVETLTGNVRGSIATSDLAGDRPLAAVFDHRGEWAAVLSGGAGSGELVVVETDTGREGSRMRIPVTGDVIQFCDENHVLIDGEALVSLAKSRVVWNYELTTGVHCRESLGGYHWYVAAINASDKSYILSGAELPEEAIRKQIDASTRTASVVHRPTDPIQIQVITSDLTGPHVINHIKETFAQRYTAAGASVTDDAPFAFTIDPGSMGVQRTSVWKVSLMQAGSPVWSSWIKGTPTGALLLASEPGGTAFADPPEVRSALAGLLQFHPPMYAFAPGAAQGDGRSMLTTSGPRPER
ncbi:hypothetical protein Pan44_08580 [Caulifigura coniformis]|uniref:Uncharacterized protein n=1 Tax=Caulifigura coniformis TaxID=2527983 RepID=A0A517S9P0_9PLAN|nr:hypothetical protein [Caulifigura coniformis]QDT52845.1 hypothetical protein Pan44_08580 [Caulifigura coniformis]